MDENVLSKLGFEPAPIGSLRSAIGRQLYKDAVSIFPWNRSITGVGVEQTHHWISSRVEGFVSHTFKSGEAVFDWVIPNEWNVKEAWIKDSEGNIVVDFNENNLHLLNYSEPVDKILSNEEMDDHLYSLPEMPDAIPYVTSYYKKRWGFCMSHNQRLSLQEGYYHAYINSSLQPGELKLGEIKVPGQSKEEILISTYTCHPSMANNEVSGIVVATMIARWLQSQANLHYSYRIVFCPETVGSLAFLSRNYETLKENLVAGFVVTMVGDDRGFTFTQTPNANSIADRVAEHVINCLTPNPNIVPHTGRVSDERQYCSPGINLPVVSIMRCGKYPEYHTSEDNLDLISPVGLYGGFEFTRLCLSALELNVTPHWKIKGEPHLTKYDLRSTIGGPRKLSNFEAMVSQVLAFSDGSRDLLEIADLIGEPIWEVFKTTMLLNEKKLITLSK
ncbi:DUF4910 domain-containing protein [bacterium]|nr:DUF4910 domain-containing protein [bacterium]